MTMMHLSKRISLKQKVFLYLMKKILTLLGIKEVLKQDNQNK